MSAQLPIASGRRSFSYIWQKLLTDKLRLALVIFMFLLEATTALAIPLVVGRIVDTVSSSATDDTAKQTTMLITLLIVAAVSSGVFTWLGYVALAKLVETLIAELREDYVSAALTLPRSTIETAGTGDVVTRASDDISHISGELPEIIPSLFVAVFTILLAGTAVSTLDLRFIWVFLIIALCYVLSVRWYLRTAPQIYREQRRVESERGQDILGTLDNLDTVTALQLGEQQLTLIATSSWQKVRWAMRTRIVQNRMFGRLNIIQALGLLLTLGLSVWLAMNNQITAGVATAAVLLFQRIIGPLQRLIYLLDDLQAALASIGRLIGVIDVPRVSLIASHADVEGLAVRLEKLSFSYPGSDPVLHNVSFDVSIGETVAVVGPSGSGKTTVASLIAGIYEQTSGTLNRGVDPQRVIMLTQDAHIFIGTIADNLRLVNPHATENELWAALDTVQMAEFVRELPQSLGTQIGHGWLSLTPAQAQLLALARLALADPLLIILDEATAEADTADGELIDKAARDATRGRSTLTIAHRLSQAAQADRIIVLDQGTVVESGTHQELLDAKTTYAGLWDAWSQGRTQ